MVVVTAKIYFYPLMKAWTRLREKISNWELWPFALRYAPLAPLWLWLALKAKHFWFFSPANPTITFAGFDGETKKEMYDLLPQGSYPKTVYLKPAQRFEEVKSAFEKYDFHYPVCVKPDKGLKGLLFRKIDNEAQLKYYHEKVPVEYVLQEMIEWPVEASVFYYRYPNEESGRITGFIQKEMMQVVGDGKQTLLELIQQHPKAKHRQDEMQVKHRDKLQSVIAAGETYLLAHAANLNRGARFINLHHLINDELVQLFDEYSHHCKFYYGRYDLKCRSIEELIKGEFSILEFNGAGAEPNHVYNAGYSWWQALKEIAHHWKVMYRIGKVNHKNGVRYWGNREGYTFLKAASMHAALLEKADREILF